ncbi:uncharacterized protein LOC109721225, partial [Ananas comosus]|uniref:Uncharacterized protein LOC109721225 n=1 Tax=Ananas comosus TaxID=4615 RepID=A0A6P5G7I3_ANACO
MGIETIINSMSHGFHHHGGGFSFSDGFDRSVTRQGQQQHHVAQQSRRDKLRLQQQQQQQQGFVDPALLPIEEEEEEGEDQDSAIYEPTGAAPGPVSSNIMLSEMFSFAATPAAAA